MPLRDHFRPSKTMRRPWRALHATWPIELVRLLKAVLPEGYQAEPSVQPGSPFEIDVSAYESNGHHFDGDSDGDGGTATLVLAAPTLTVEVDLTEQDEFELRVYDSGHDRTLVAAIEIVSPANKDRPRTRDQFVGKVAALLGKNVCVAIVDLVTTRRANPYAELLERLGVADPALGPMPSSLYAVSLRSRKPTNRPKRPGYLDAWFHPMTLGQSLPTLPLWLSPELKIDVNLETSYEAACDLLDIP